jgi:hypothetical protein
VSLFDLAQKSRDVRRRRGLPVATRTVAPPSRPRPQTKMATLERPRAAASVQVARFLLTLLLLCIGSQFQEQETCVAVRPRPKVS